MDEVFLQTEILRKVKQFLSFMEIFVLMKNHRHHTMKLRIILCR